MATTSKKRKHAPSPDIFAHSPASPTHPHTRPWQPTLDAPLRDLGKEFERFLNYLHDAAVLINHPNEQQPRQYSRVSVLLLGWQDDPASTDNIRSLQDVFESDYQYSTHTWYLPTTAKPSAQLSVRMTSFLEQARPDDLLIVYYYGHGYQGSDGQIYWACTAEDRSAKLKWDTFQCLFEDVQYDMLLFLDTCSVPITIASNRSVKQVVAAYSPETSQYTSPAALRYFTPCLVAALRNLSRARSFSVQALYHEIKDVSIANSKSGHPFPSTALAPEFFVMTPDKSRDLQLPVLPCSAPVTTPEPTRAMLNPTPTSASMPLDFDEPRVLVCTTVSGAECPSISTIHSWMQNTPVLASQLTVEGMFVGPRTVLTLSMPSNLWDNVQHDKNLYCLGTVKSRNMAHLYDKMFSPPPLAKPTPTIPRDPSPVPATATASQAIHHAHSRQNSISMTHRSSPLQPGYILPRAMPAVKVGQSPRARMYQSPPQPVQTVARPDSVEVQKAAEQLQAMRHLNHSSAEAEGPSGNATLKRHAEPVMSLHSGFRNLSRSDSLPVIDSGNGPTRSKLKWMLGKPEICCAHCTHVPFKDSSSLRKHIAAAHTPPFPCAFHFAGCTTIFGSKNEWKRHIASRHLCLQYYRCSTCATTATDGESNEFNRKDLFTAHLRRMHASPEVKHALDMDDSSQLSDWGNYVTNMQQTCLIQRRRRPQRLNCPKPGCRATFEGATAWDKWTEHVGRHMGRGESDNLGVDALLRQYAIDEGIIEQTGDRYRLLPTTPGSGSNQSKAAGSRPETSESSLQLTHSKISPHMSPTMSLHHSQP